MLKIGIDAKWLYSGVISGRLFIRNLLPELFALYPEIEWHVFLNKKDKREDTLLLAENIRTHYVWAGFNMISNLFILPKYARRLKLDAVFYQTFPPKGHNYKSIVLTHDILSRSHPHYFSFKENLYLFPLRWCVTSADKVITTTEFVKNELLKYKYVSHPSSIDLAPLGISTRFKPANEHDPHFLASIKKKFDLPSSYLLYTGRINKRKNLHGLLAAMKLLSDKQIPLIIVGSEDRKQANLKPLLADPSLKKRVLFTGTISDEDLSGIYAQAAVFCFPSFAEGFGLPPLEAMASGVPVVVSKTTSMPEACGKAARFIDPSQPQSIADGIDDLLKNHELREQKIKEGLYWSKQYTWKRTAEQIMQGILSTLGNNDIHLTKSS